MQKKDDAFLKYNQNIIFFFHEYFGIKNRNGNLRRYDNSRKLHDVQDIEFVIANTIKKIRMFTTPWYIE